MKRRDLLGLFVIAAPMRVERSEPDVFQAMSRRQFQMGQKVWASSGCIKCCGIIIGFLYLAPNEFTTDGWQYAIWVTDVGEGCVSPVEWFDPWELKLMTVEDLDLAIAPLG